MSFEAAGMERNWRGTGLGYRSRAKFIHDVPADRSAGAGGAAGLVADLGGDRVALAAAADAVSLDELGASSCTISCSPLFKSKLESGNSGTSVKGRGGYPVFTK
jgi:hypothetical protein